MTDSISSNTQPASPGSTVLEPGEQTKHRGKRGGSKRGSRHPEGSDFQRQNRPRIDRSMSGYGDGIERAMCLSVPSLPPPFFPVQHRTGLAVRALATVARTDSAALLCDRQHDGPHIWPNGDVVGEITPASAHLIEEPPTGQT